jgi:hypothetical protein
VGDEELGAALKDPAAQRSQVREVEAFGQGGPELAERIPGERAA